MKPCTACRGGRYVAVRWSRNGEDHWRNVVCSRCRGSGKEPSMPIEAVKDHPMDNFRCSQTLVMTVLHAKMVRTAVRQYLCEYITEYTPPHQEKALRQVECALTRMIQAP